MGRYEIVAIGSSAGGINALDIVLSGLPSDLPVPVLIVQHLDRKHHSLMAEIMQRRCLMKVKEAEDGEKIEQRVVYIAPPNRHMLVKDGHISLTSTPPVNFSRPSVGLMLESVAATYADRSIGIILTGTGRDGSRGIKAIKEAGVTTIAQDQATSEHFGMPQASIDTGMIDFILPVRDIPKAIIRLINSTTENMAQK